MNAFDVCTVFWCVVERHVRDNQSRGEIIRGGLTEDQAKAFARACDPNGSSKFNYWAMPRKDY